MALPKFYRFSVKNETGVTVLAGEISMIFTRKKRGPADNALVYESEVSLTNASSIPNGGVGPIGAVQSNATPGWEEGDGTFQGLMATATPNGDLILFIELSGNGGAFADSDRKSFPISIINITTSSSIERTDFRF